MGIYSLLDSQKGLSIRLKVKTMVLRPKLLEFLKWLIIDVYRVFRYGRHFKEYGLTMYCGRQGGGKSISIVERLERMRVKYPDALIMTNFGYVNEHAPMKSWRELLEVRNGDNGVIFAIDEIQNEWNSNDWKDFPENLLSEITMQRKQKIKILASSQVFTRVVKQLREQCYDVVECRTLAGRWTFQRCFDAEDYNGVIDNPEKKKRLHRSWRYSFVQTDDIRRLFDSYKKIQAMKDKQFIPRHER